MCDNNMNTISYVSRERERTKSNLFNELPVWLNFLYPDWSVCICVSRKCLVSLYASPIPFKKAQVERITKKIKRVEYYAL